MGNSLNNFFTKYNLPSDYSCYENLIRSLYAIYRDSLNKKNKELEMDVVSAILDTYYKYNIGVSHKYTVQQVLERPLESFPSPILEGIFRFCNGKKIVKIANIEERIQRIVRYYQNVFEKHKLNNEIKEDYEFEKREQDYINETISVYRNTCINKEVFIKITNTLFPFLNLKNFGHINPDVNEKLLRDAVKELIGKQLKCLEEGEGLYMYIGHGDSYYDFLKNNDNTIKNLKNLIKSQSVVWCYVHADCEEMNPEAHALMFVYNRKHNISYLFNPWGSYLEGIQFRDNFFNLTFTYIKTVFLREEIDDRMLIIENACGEGIQRLYTKDKGFCFIYCLMFKDACIENPSMDPRAIEYNFTKLANNESVFHEILWRYYQYSAKKCNLHPVKEYKDLFKK